MNNIKSVLITKAFKICLYKHNGVEVPQEKSQLKVEKKILKCNVIATELQ